MKKTCLFILFTLIAFIPLTTSAQMTRFPNGLTNSSPEGNFSELPVLNPVTVHIVFDDFEKFDYASSMISPATRAVLSASSTWMVTSTVLCQTSPPGMPTYPANYTIVNSSPFGVARIENATSFSDSSWVYGATSFIPTAGKKLWFSARYQIVGTTDINDVTRHDSMIGLEVQSASPMAPANGIFFRTPDDHDGVEFVSTAASVNVTATTITTLARSMKTVGFYYDGDSELKYYVDGVHTGTLATTSVPTGTALAPAFGIKNGEDRYCGTILVDYIFVAQER